jgi:hypothetical protein
MSPAAPPFRDSSFMNLVAPGQTAVKVVKSLQIGGILLGGRGMSPIAEPITGSV